MFTVTVVRDRKNMGLAENQSDCLPDSFPSPLEKNKQFLYIDGAVRVLSRLDLERNHQTPVNKKKAAEIEPRFHNFPSQTEV